MKNYNREEILALVKSQKVNQFTPQRIASRLTKSDLLRIQKIMRKKHKLNITDFLGLFRVIISPSPEDDFYLTYGLFEFFEQLCMEYRVNEVTFDQISNLITQMMPPINQQVRVKEKLFPLNLEIPDQIKKNIFAPEIIGKVIQERQRLQQRHFASDRFMHLNRRVAQTEYSIQNDMFLTIDYPSMEIRLLDSKFQILKIIQTQLNISKRDAIITYIAWSQYQQRIACLLGNYSISMWAKQDNYRYEVNIPLPNQQLRNPYVILKYMQSSKKWFAIDNRPAIQILSSYNFQPEHEIVHFKMIKEKESEKILCCELKYRRLICVAFERNLFLISLEKRQIVTQMKHFRTSITSIAFSESYQALFVSNFENYFNSYELSEFMDLTQKGKFEGHKYLITLIGVLEKRPVVYSLEETSILKLWDIRDFTCYQTFSVLKNILFHQVLALPDSICFVGSKMYRYRWSRFSTFQQTQRVILLDSLNKNILMVTSKEVKLFGHTNGVLLKVIRGIFKNGYISKAFVISIRKQIMLINDEGQVKLYSAKDFFQINHEITIPPKPIAIFYDKYTDLLTTCCMSQIIIFQYTLEGELKQKRRITNTKQILKFCKVSKEHDLVVSRFQYSDYLFFYSFERAKGIGFLVLKDFVDLYIVPSQNILIILCTDKLIVFTFKKTQASIAFFMKIYIDLWEEQQINKFKINFNIKPFEKIKSTGMVFFGETAIIASNDACLQCRISFKFQNAKADSTPKSKQTDNPYRLANEDHNQMFQMNKPSIVIQDSCKSIFIEKRYLHNRGNLNFCLISAIFNFYVISDSKDSIFYNIDGQQTGIINFTDTIPQIWQINNYSQDEFNKLEFILKYISAADIDIQSNEDWLSPTKSMELQHKEKAITLSMILDRSYSPERKLKSTSLRDKKMVLEKQRDEKQKEENYLIHRKAEELIKMKYINKSSNQKYVGESIAFLNINRNKLIMNKGIPDLQILQVRLLEAKLNASINRDDKKSMVSKYSNPYQFSSPLKRITNEVAIQKAVQQANQFIKIDNNEKQRSQSIREKIKRMEKSVFKIKFQHKNRSNSLPSLARK